MPDHLPENLEPIGHLLAAMYDFCAELRQFSVALAASNLPEPAALAGKFSDKAKVLYEAFLAVQSTLIEGLSDLSKEQTRRAHITGVLSRFISKLSGQGEQLREILQTIAGELRKDSKDEFADAVEGCDLATDEIFKSISAAQDLFQRAMKGEDIPDEPEQGPRIHF